MNQESLVLEYELVFSRANFIVLQEESETLVLLNFVWPKLVNLWDLY